jgi:hypothetical protein
MQLSFGRDRSRFVPTRVVTAVLGVLLAGVVVGAALAATQTKKFSASIVQTAQTTYLLTLTNDPTSTQPFGSSNVTVPAGFSVSSVSIASTPSGKTWTSTLSGSTIQLRAASTKSGLAPGQSVTVTIDATASCGSYTFDTGVKQSNNFLGTGNDFVGDDPSVSVIGPAATFLFGTIGSPKQVGTPFSISATAKDACANTASFYNGTAALTGLDATQNASPTPSTLSFGSGSATATVTAVKAQEDADLTATDGAATGTSNSFDVVTRICTSPSQPCTASNDDGTSVTVPAPPGGTTLLSLSGPGNSFTCEGTTYQNVGSSVLVDPAGGGYGVSPIEVVVTWSLVNAPSGNRVVCMTKDEGATYFEVPRCGNAPVPPCELDRDRSGDVLRAVILIDPTDPEFDLG